MVFSSIPFLFFFFPIFLVLYYLVPFKTKNIILLIFSLIFYAWGEPIYIFLMIFSSLVDYFCGKMIEKNFDNRKKKLFLLCSIITNLFILGFFKYTDFLIQSVNSFFNTSISLLELGLPIGISFYTFQTMSYCIDVYRGEVKAEKHFINYMTYVSMFPQLVAGPIVRYETVSKELEQRTISFNNFSIGLMRFLRGLFKKVLIANNVGYLWGLISVMPNNEMSVLMAWLGIVAFAFQIYFDFSGYSDMAIGMGKMLGFNYLENFNFPYIAKSITDFWRRWHISLSTWFKDYVYIPLGGSRVNKLLNIRNISIVWMLTGIWHGAAWNFVLWGLYYGVLLIVEKFVLNKVIEKWPNWVKHLYTLILVLIGWLIFAFDDINLLFNYAKVMFGFSDANFINNNFIYYFSNYFVMLVIGVLFSIPVLDFFNKRFKFKKDLYALILGVLVYTLLFILSISCLVSDTYNPFLYFRF